MASRKSAKSDAAPESKEEPYHTKHRPRKLAEVAGQVDVVHSLVKAIAAKNRQHCFFFFGPGGTGKTTLARILAREFGCAPANVVEVDAASNSSIDEMRALMVSLRYEGFGDTPNRMYIIDECHRLSANAWDSLLKSTEEPPQHAFFVFCSTAPSKIPAAMLTRGPQYVLKPLRFDDLMDVLEAVVKVEALDVPQPIVELVARSCDGSMRQALVMLAMVEACEGIEDAEELLAGQGETKEVIDLCRALVKGDLSWKEVQRNLKPIENLGAESIRILVTLYIAKVLMGASERDAGRLLDILQAFSKPCNQTDKLAPILLAFGEFADFGRR